LITVNTDRADASERRNTARLAKETALKLLDYCRSRDWAGIDPYDALNSRIFQALPVLDRRIPRLILSQALKRSIVNLRPLLLVGPAQNPKALALFLTSLLRLSEAGVVGKEQEGSISAILRDLESLRSPNCDQWCWGYSFPWQTRTLLVPRWAPNLVCTTFVANALLDAYERLGDKKLLEMATSSASYILDELYWTGGADVAGFAYPLPSMRNNVHNGNLLAAALLSRVAKHTGNERFLEPALKAARFSVSRQHRDGSWDYGESPAQKWIDNFHTGFNLCALREMGQHLSTNEFEPSVQRGFTFYRDHFFRADGAAKYYHNNAYPIDIHCVAQSIITLLALKDLDANNVSLAQKVFAWAIDRMWEEAGYFSYRVLRIFTIRTSYMRWSQAWMLLALTALVCDAKENTAHPPLQGPAAAVQVC
jgi:hypothetical protein